MAVCGQDLVMKDISSVVNALQKASSLLGKKYGETDDQYEDPVYYNGLALLNPARKENNILGDEPMEKIPEDDKSSEDPGVPSTSNLDEKEEEGFRLEVYDAVSEKDEKANKVNEDSKGDSKAEEAKADELECEKSSDVPKTKDKAEEGMSSLPASTPDLVLFNWLVFRCFGERREMLEEEPRRKRMWVHPIIAQRACKGQFQTMYADLREHPAKFVRYCRMSFPTFDLLLGELRPGLTFMNTNMRRCVSAEERLIITLRFLATGNSFASLHFEFRMGTSTIAGIVRATCATMWLRLRAAVLPQPTRQQWLQIAQGFQKRAQFPNCIGALDGKHIRVKKPPNSGSRFYNYKQFFSVVLLALADTNYRFIIVDIGAYGSLADARIFRASRMGRWLQSNQLDLPQPGPLPGSSGPPAPYVIVGDEGFALSPNLMRPFPRRGLNEERRTFNYRLSRARSVCSARMHEASPDDDAEVLTSAAHGDPSLLGRAGLAGLRVREFFSDYFMSPAGSFTFIQQPFSSGQR
ncbi:uncharacterized protein LOC120990767 [Bufo bufo]|uniref:uncharacterized protein LOC120990767 n=1 Tax=Bufo bufo TaxID=8384 RepID=UPI001ABEC94A|nr:uncharacterized protein LOC120990767 [Bufo bufo]